MLERKSHLVWLPSVSLLFLALAAGAAAEELWVAPTHSVIASLPPALDVTWPVTSGGVAVFGFSVPDDMRSFDSARVVILPNGTGTGVYSVFAEVKRDGELLSPFDIEAQQNLPLTLTNDEVTEVDVSSVLTPVVDATSGGRDYVSLFFLSPSLIGNARVLGLRFRYERTPIGGSLLAPDAVDSSKVLDGSLTSSDVQNGSLTGADIADGTVGGLDIANGAIDGARILDGSVASADIQDF